MASRQTILFATRTDMEPGLKAIESSIPLHYVAVEMYDKPVFEEYDSLLSWPHLGMNLTGVTTTGNRIFLAGKKDLEIRHEVIPQRKGGVRYSFGQLMNPDTIAFSPGGLYGESALVAGSVGTASNSPASAELYKKFRKALIKDFVNVKGVFAGAEALRLMQQGGRLTHDVRAPKEYDLTP